MEPGKNALSIPKIDLKDPSSFLRKKLTLEEAEERLNILSAEQKILKETDKDLTPRSLKELGQLTEVLSKEEKPDLVKITRLSPGQFYQIEFKADPIHPKIEKFNQLSSKINAIKSNVMTTPQTAILECLIQPSQEIELYKKGAADFPQMEFLDALRLGYVANLQLLQLAKSFEKNSKYYIMILNLHKSSFDLYQDQINCYRQCESAILEHSKKTFQSILGVRDSILTFCGPKLSENPEEFLTKNKEILSVQVENDENLPKQIINFWKDFLIKLSQFEENVSNYANEIIKEMNIVLKNVEKEHVDVNTLKLSSDSLKKTVRSLSEILCELIDFKLVLKLKQSAAQKEMECMRWKISFQNVKQESFKNALDGVDWLEEVVNQFAGGHLIWVQSTKQSYVIKQVQHVENEMKNSVIEGVATRSNSGNAIKDAIQLASSEQDPLFKKFATHEQLLEQARAALDS